MQATENGPLNGSKECEKMLGKVGDHIMKGGYTAQDFRADKIKFMKNVEHDVVENEEQ